jgi:O-antigen ligase
MMNTLYSLSRSTAHLLIILFGISFFFFPDFEPSLFSIFGKEIFITQILMLLAVVFSVFYLLHDWRDGQVRLPRIVTTLFVLLGSSLVVMALSTFFAGHPTSALMARLFSLTAIFLTVFLFATLPSKRVSQFLIAASVVAITSSILGILQFYFLGDLASLPSYFGERFTHLQATGFARYSSFFGSSMALFFPLFWVLSLKNYANKKTLWVTAACFSAAGLLLSFSRSAMLAGVICGLVVIYWSWKSDVNKKYLGLSILFIGLSLGAAFFYVPPERLVLSTLEGRRLPKQMLVKRFEFVDDVRKIFVKANSAEVQVSGDLSKIKDFSAYSRYAFHVAAWNMITQSPQAFLFGLGVGGFADNWKAFEPKESSLDLERPTPHSLFLEALVSGGVVGFGLLISFFMLLFIYTTKKLPGTIVTVALLVGILGLLIDGAFHTSLYSKYLWIGVGIIMSMICMQSMQAIYSKHKFEDENSDFDTKGR